MKFGIKEAQKAVVFAKSKEQFKKYLEEKVKRGIS